MVVLLKYSQVNFGEKRPTINQVLPIGFMEQIIHRRLSYTLIECLFPSLQLTDYTDLKSQHSQLHQFVISGQLISWLMLSHL